MNTNHDRLALRRQSIRTLTADELRMAQGGEGGNGTGTGRATKHTTVPTTGTRTGTRPNPTLTATHSPPQTLTVA
ncbi:hypothetical protein [Mycobacterium paraffinicum]|uniref:Uncharacterized protein n=1 Tax=Mycobacterium paraffinicum TaxID=53378 RepID=A0ABP8F0C2_9MYCO|nr:hypothetical protein [Mycobacterium paraffinicum]MCV7312229.1 hypothetical protein [Mycobacterium paraffinicum]